MPKKQRRIKVRSKPQLWKKVMTLAEVDWFRQQLQVVRLRLAQLLSTEDDPEKFESTVKSLKIKIDELETVLENTRYKHKRLPKLPEEEKELLQKSKKKTFKAKDAAARTNRKVRKRRSTTKRDTDARLKAEKWSREALKHWKDEN